MGQGESISNGLQLHCKSCCYRFQRLLSMWELVDRENVEGGSWLNDQSLEQSSSSKRQEIHILSVEELAYRWCKESYLFVVASNVQTQSHRVSATWLKTGSCRVCFCHFSANLIPQSFLHFSAIPHATWTSSAHTPIYYLHKKVSFCAQTSAIETKEQLQFIWSSLKCKKNSKQVSKNNQWGLHKGVLSAFELKLEKEVCQLTWVIKNNEGNTHNLDVHPNLHHHHSHLEVIFQIWFKRQQKGGKPN
jgi:hypothetical protein